MINDINIRKRIIVLIKIIIQLNWLYIEIIAKLSFRKER